MRPKIFPIRAVYVDALMTLSHLIHQAGRRREGKTSYDTTRRSLIFPISDI